tara:strand:- start:781 stop:1437 length:657 start_codon:yes stop_codon:yes gene_type:complete
MEKKLTQNKIYSNNMKYKEKYEDLFTGGYYIRDSNGKKTKTRGGYGDGGGIKRFLKEIKQFVDKNPGCMLLEYGCGRSIHWHTKVKIHEFIPLDEEGNKTIVEEEITMTEYLGPNLGGFYRYDPFHPIYKVRPPSQADAVIICDVLEHIPIEELPAVLKDINKHTRVGGTVFITIPHNPSKCTFMNGENMHCTLMSRKKWKNILTQNIRRKIQVKYTA